MDEVLDSKLKRPTPRSTLGLFVSKFRQFCSPSLCLSVGREAISQMLPIGPVSMPGEENDSTRGVNV